MWEKGEDNDIFICIVEHYFIVFRNEEIVTQPKRNLLPDIYCIRAISGEQWPKIIRLELLAKWAVSLETK